MIGPTLYSNSEQTWPAEGLECVPNCPICSSEKRSLLYTDLWDDVFFAAPGRWSLWRCHACRSAWLDPRPNEATIGIAYQSYYTHAEKVELSQPQTTFQRLRSALGNAYRNARYGTRLSPAYPLGRVIASLLPPARWPIDAAYRYLPRHSQGKMMRALDIGCANGAWLELARGAGWEVAGIEPDPVSRAQALDRGIDVFESLTPLLATPQCFDYVTISHVIEHVHDPLALLRNIFALLRPGGQLYVDTPNIEAFGHMIYGRNWRGLEPPRHLILFNRASLSNAIRQAGFGKIQFRSNSNAFSFTSQQSRRTAAGLDPYSDESSANLPPPPGLLQRLRATTARRRAEFLTLTAIKPW